jgi:hypothetical protein
MLVVSQRLAALPDVQEYQRLKYLPSFALQALRTAGAAALCAETAPINADVHLPPSPLPHA